MTTWSRAPASAMPRRRWSCIAISSTCGWRSGAPTAPDRPRSRPTHLRRQAHQDRIHVAARLQAKQRAAVMDQVEFDIAAAADQLVFTVRCAPRLAHAAADDAWINVKKCLPHVANKAKIRLYVATEVVVEEDAARSTRLLPVRQIEVAVAPRLEFWIVGRVVPVARRPE